MAVILKETDSGEKCRCVLVHTERRANANKLGSLAKGVGVGVVGDLDSASGQWVNWKGIVVNGETWNETVVTEESYSGQ